MTSASAPGKIILTGEYAVLDGAPALVAAVDRRATATVTAATQGVTVHAPDLGVRAVGRFEAGRLHWVADPATTEALALVTCVLEALNARSRGHTAAQSHRPDSSHSSSPSGTEQTLSALSRGYKVCSVPTGSAHNTGGLEIHLSTAEFFDNSGDTGTGGKLGLGSSAALTVALAGAVAAHWGQPEPTLVELVAIHRAFQGGRGSGTDIAAAHTGGLLLYEAGTSPAAPLPTEQNLSALSRPYNLCSVPISSAHTKEGTPRATPVELPAGVSWSVIFTGRSASTSAMLATLGAWRAEHPTEYAGAMARLTAIAHRVAACVTPAGTVINNDDEPRDTAGSTPAGRVINSDGATTFLDAVDEYARALDELGTAAGIDIMSPDHRYLRTLAAEYGVVYKPSGAGGGDIGIAFSREPQQLGSGAVSRGTGAGNPTAAADVYPHGPHPDGPRSGRGATSRDTSHKNAFRDAVLAAGYRMIEVAIDPRGLIIDGSTDRGAHPPDRNG